MLKLMNRYKQLPTLFYSPHVLTPFPKAELLWINDDLVNNLCEGEIIKDTLIDSITGQSDIFDKQSIALAYAGHQFGHFVPSLGDGRALLLGQLRDHNGNNIDLHLKGSGPTIYSRGGDGLSPLGPVIREMILSEAMHHLSIPTTRTLAAFRTQNEVYRQSVEPGGLLVRTCESLLRIGTFEYAASRKAFDELKSLVDFAIDLEKSNHSWQESSQHPYLNFFHSICQKQAQLIAKWCSVGFVHGVMNTDNMSISGETIDYGPCAFLDTYDPGAVFSSIDQQGRYAFDKQAQIAHWNLYILALCLLPIIENHTSKARAILQEELDNFLISFEGFWLTEMRKKIGIHHSTLNARDRLLIDNLLKIMKEERLDYTLTFRHLSQQLREKGSKVKEQISLPIELNAQFIKNKALSDWRINWIKQLEATSEKQNMIAVQMDRVNPIVIARNHLVEKAIQAVMGRNDILFLNEFQHALKNPFDTPKNNINKLIAPPQPNERVLKTFCGT